MVGAERDTTIIEAHADISAASSRVFTISPAGVAGMSRLTIRHGAITGAGGGIFNEGDLTLDDVLVQFNNASLDGGGIYNTSAGQVAIANSEISFNLSQLNGGGIHNDSGSSLTMTNSLVLNTFATVDGGGVFNAGSMTVNDTFFQNNAAGSRGGGIDNSGALNLNTSTFQGNSGASGGAIYNGSFGALAMINDTVSGNSANLGGGVFNDGTASLLHVTITNNGADVGAGIFNNGGSLDIQNTIVGGQGAGSDCGGPEPVTSLDHNIDSDGTCNLGGANDQPNTPPDLGARQDNGGPTLTHMPNPGSPAIDMGIDVIGSDQRGVVRPQGVTSDVGSVEVEGGPPSEHDFTVTKEADTDDGSCDPADCSLREAVGALVAGLGDSIFVPTGVYTLDLGRLDLNRGDPDPMSIWGEGRDLTIIEAAPSPGLANSEIFFIAAGNEVIISDVTIRHGVSENGGGIFNAGTLNLMHSSVLENEADVDPASAGGGIYNSGSLMVESSWISENHAVAGGGIFSSGSLVVMGSHVDHNVADLDGGGIRVLGGTASLSHTSVNGNMSGATGTGGGLWTSAETSIDSSTIDNNHSDGGSGIWNLSTLDIVNSTISNNFSNGFAGGIFSAGNLSLLNSTVAANSSGGPVTGGGIHNVGALQATNTIIGINQVGGDCSAPITSLGNNLDSDDTCGLDLGLDDQPGVNPMLADLGDFGGPTWTHALMPTSPAIDAGNDSMAPLVDQRGLPAAGGRGQRYRRLRGPGGRPSRRGPHF